MNCRHVLGLIDAGPSADYPPVQLEAAWRHARGCPTCGPALETSTALARELVGLSHIDPPAHLAASVAARIARLDGPHRVTGDASRARTTSAVSDWWPTVSTAVGGAIAAVVLVAALPPGEWTTLWLEALWAGGSGMGPLLRPASSGQMLALAGGIVLFVTGLFLSRDPRARRN